VIPVVLYIYIYIYIYIYNSNNITLLVILLLLLLNRIMTVRKSIRGVLNEVDRLLSVAECLLTEAGWLFRKHILPD
jgi:hypothetical protein